MKTYDIDLLPKKEKSIADKLLYFILHYFRYVIVLTQIVVISVFFYRFQIDQFVIDEKDKFKQRQQILAATEPIVESAENVAYKTDRIDSLLQRQKTLLDQYNFIINSIPQTIVLNSLIVEPDGADMIGVSTDTLSIRALNKNLVERGVFLSSRIALVEKREGGDFKFIISASLKPEDGLK